MKNFLKDWWNRFSLIWPFYLVAYIVTISVSGTCIFVYKHWFNLIQWIGIIAILVVIYSLFTINSPKKIEEDTETIEAHNKG